MLAQPILFDVTGFLLLELAVIAIVLWKINSRVSEQAGSLEAIRQWIKMIEENHMRDLDSIRKHVRFLTGVIVAHFTPHDEQTRKLFEELDAID